MQQLRQQLGGLLVTPKCHTCGGEVDVFPDPPAPDCCPDHEYEYDRGRRGHYCKTCDKQSEPDSGGDLYD